MARYVANILGQAQTISTRIDESSLSNSANARVPGHVVQPGLVSVIERESARKGSKQFDDGLRCPRGLERDSADPLQTRVHRNEVRNLFTAYGVEAASRSPDTKPTRSELHQSRPDRCASCRDQRV